MKGEFRVLQNERGGYPKDCCKGNVFTLRKTYCILL